MVDSVKIPIPQWLRDAVHENTFRAFPDGNARPMSPAMPPISADAVRALMEDIVSICAKHGIWLSHEDDHGGFLVQRKPTREWLLGARGYE